MRDKVIIRQAIDIKEIWEDTAREYLMNEGCIPPIHRKGCGHKFDGIEIPIKLNNPL